ncbi:hypothetical protein RI367_000990 [Sorochytrium milnesiophthora]
MDGGSDGSDAETRHAVSEITNGLFRKDDGTNGDNKVKRPPRVIAAMPNNSKVYQGSASTVAAVSNQPTDSASEAERMQEDKQLKQSIETQFGLLVKPSKRRRVELDRQRLQQSGPPPSSDTADASKTDAAPTGAMTDKEILDHDVAALPDECTMDTYDALPIEDFGTALLRGMGWKEGQAVGRNPKSALIKPIEYIPRPQLLGIGAQPLPQPDDLPELIGKHKASRRQQHDYEMPTREDGTVRHYRTVDEQLQNRRKLKLEEKCFVLITHGRHADLEGQVLELRKEKGTATVKLSSSGTTVRVDTRDVKVIDPHDRKPSSSAPSSSKSRDTEPARSLSRHQVWVRSGLRVRIVSKSLGGGRHYNKKATVVDVLPGGVVNAKLEETGQYVDQVPQSALETIVPHQGDNVVVVRCASDPDAVGARGRIMEKDKKREKVLLQLDDDSIVQYEFDDVCALA